MKYLKNTITGFCVSFVGSLPLGYLNVLGLVIYGKQGIPATCLYLLGVVCIEFPIIYLTLIFAKKFLNNTKLIRFIDGFSIVFMFTLAYLFYKAGNAEAVNYTVFRHLYSNTFLSGIILSLFNFIQIPFWLSWNLYLLNEKMVDFNYGRYLYVLGALAGTFLGMLTLILSLYYFAANVSFLSEYLLKYIIPFLFICFGILKFRNLYRNYYSE